MPWRDELGKASACAQRARFDEMNGLCHDIVRCHGRNVNALLDVGGLLMQFGFLTAAASCFQDAMRLAPQDLRPVVNLANVAREFGSHEESRRLYDELQQRLPDHVVVRRNALVGLEYDPQADAATRLELARDWGRWAQKRAGGPFPRPACASQCDGRPLRVGYVSADLCQHTVGMFVRDVLARHDARRVQATAYSAGRLHDDVTRGIAAHCTFVDVSRLDDPSLAERIRADAIDVLVDLSGHTANSRLTVFAYRPAPVQVSWLGYFATTGLDCMDAVLFDDWHVHVRAEGQFCERIVRLPQGRFCFRPPGWARIAIDPLPCLNNGYVTFGSFNNTSKLNSGVYDVWAAVLREIPEARLVLKWRNFVDDHLCTVVRTAFERRGVDPDRLELRGASFHRDMLGQYNDIDIALDPFPFTGGMTSCEALWMGVPVVTWPQERTVSRQTFAILGVLGLDDLAASGPEEYVRLAAGLARDITRLDTLRQGLRTRMQASVLMDAGAFAQQLEDCYEQLFHELCPAAACERPDAEEPTA